LVPGLAYIVLKSRFRPRPPVCWAARASSPSVPDGIRERCSEQRPRAVASAAPD